MHEFLRRAASDIKEKKNLENYLVLAILIVLLIADIFGIANDQALTEIILASLALLIYGLIESSHTNEQSQEQISHLSNKLDSLDTSLAELPSKSLSDLFTKGYPDFSKELREAKRVSILGINLRRTTLNYISEFEYILNHNGKLRFLLTEPTPEVLSFLMFRNPQLEAQYLTNTLYDVVRDITRLNKSASETENLKIKLMPYIPPMSMFIFERRDGSAVVYVRFRSFRVYSTEQHVLTVEKAYAPELYSFYFDQFEAFWAEGRPAAPP